MRRMERMLALLLLACLLTAPRMRHMERMLALTLLLSLHLLSPPPPFLPPHGAHEAHATGCRSPHLVIVIEGTGCMKRWPAASCLTTSRMERKLAPSVPAWGAWSACWPSAHRYPSSLPPPGFSSMTSCIVLETNSLKESSCWRTSPFSVKNDVMTAHASSCNDTVT